MAGDLGHFRHMTGDRASLKIHADLGDLASDRAMSPDLTGDRDGA